MIRRCSERVESIPIDRITVVNSRSRGKSKFKQIVSNIANLGLKKPVMVAVRQDQSGEPRYDLVYGEGRLEAYRLHGDAAVPAIVVEASEEDVLLVGLAENLARRRHTSIELSKEILTLKERGYGFEDIARKTDLDATYVRGIVRLLNKGEKQLLRAVEHGQIPLSIAITIASSDDAAVQQALADAYESKSLRGRSLLKARRLIELRRRANKADAAAAGGGGRNGPDGKEFSCDKLMKVYHQETTRQRLMLRKSKVCETRLLFVVTAMKSLLRDAALINLLKAESLDTLPQFLAQQVQGKG